MTTRPAAFISEIYASVQGEGPFTGERQIFVRFAGCPLRCRYCDTLDSLTIKGHGRMPLEHVFAKIVSLRRISKAATVSVTGGEPLVQPFFVRDLFRKLKKAGFKTYLETAGVHPDALRRVVRDVDVIAMDIKLPSSTGKSFWDEHREFLKLGGRKIFVKVVIESRSRLSELEKAIDLLAKNSKKSLLVLQPVTPIKGQVEGANPDIIAEAYALASRKLPRVLVLPQQHKLWGVR